MVRFSKDVGGVQEETEKIADGFEIAFGKKRYVRVYTAFIKTNFTRALSPREIQEYSGMQSPAVYPTLNEMKEKGILKEIEIGGTKRYAINDESMPGRIVLLTLSKMWEYEMSLYQSEGTEISKEVAEAQI